MGSAIRLTSRNAYDKTKMTMATGSKNDAPPMSVVLTNSLKVPFKRNEVIEVKAIKSIYPITEYAIDLYRRFKHLTLLMH